MFATYFNEKELHNNFTNSNILKKCNTYEYYQTISVSLFLPQFSLSRSQGYF
jgi:hypothetical protein